MSPCISSNDEIFMETLDSSVYIEAHLYLKSIWTPWFLFHLVKIDFLFRILVATRVASAGRHPEDFSKEIVCRSLGELAPFSPFRVRDA